MTDRLDAVPFRTPHALIEWREGERFGATHLQDWCETVAMTRNRLPWHGQNYFNWARDPANQREERG